MLKSNQGLSLDYINMCYLLIPNMINFKFRIIHFTLLFLILDLLEWVNLLSNLKVIDNSII